MNSMYSNGSTLKENFFDIEENKQIILTHYFVVTPLIVRFHMIKEKSWEEKYFYFYIMVVSA